MRSHFRPLTCPSCRSRNQLATPPDGGAPPKDDDAGLCVSCGEWLIIDSRYDGGARQPSPSELADLNGDPMARAMQRYWKELGP